MNKAGKIISINPPYAISGGEVLINCEGFQAGSADEYGCYFDGQAARIVGASKSRVMAIVPDDFDTTKVEIHLENGGDRSASKNIVVGKKLADDLHIVANPAIDPKDDSVILTRSGSRGQQLPAPLFRLEKDGTLDEMPAEILNPTGIAFDADGQLFVTARAYGEVCRVSRDEEVVPFASEMGIATGIAFDKNGQMYVTSRMDGSVYRVTPFNEAVAFASNLGVATGIAFDRQGRMYIGDRTGTIHSINSIGESEEWTHLEPSVAAYHLAFGADGALYVTGPTVSSHEAVMRVDEDGDVDIFFRGLGRPSGLAFDRDGNLYVAASYRGQRGVVRITADGGSAEMAVAGMNVVGLAFSAKGAMAVATNEAIYEVPIGIRGAMLG
jgi:sugar lactone lactonase YvrE